LTFSFVGIYHRNPEAVRYKWKLEGLNEEWSPALAQHEVTYSNLSPGEYIFKVLSCNEYNVWNNDPITFEFRILPPIWKTWWFMGFSVILCFFIVWFVFHSRYKKLKEESKREKEKLEMEKSIIELEQEAARLQMNPHFIFNSLNSIQGFIATNDAFQAKKYLAKFARLMRLILENAREEYIPLQNEADMLENYLELEKLSKNNKFEFSINLSKDINTETLEIPPMMIQPFVENAIIHGIKRKEGQGRIEINFNTKSSLLICEVIDNGIGRQKSFETKDKNSKHKPTGMLVTKKRLEQLKILTGFEAGYEIIDLMDDNSNPAGTKVVISIPFETY
jgi:LytS/YehU family sensor histidine kinase